MTVADVQAVEGWMQKNHFFLRRLHSLLGIIPVGAFLIEHMLTNSLAWLGPEKFNEQVHWLHNLHYLLALEILFIFLPLAFHAVYGVVIALQGRNNIQAYPYLDNWRYLLQRITAWVTLIFVIVHLGHFRFAHWFGGTLYPGHPDPFVLTQAGFSLGMPVAAWYAIYAVGLACAVFHFANGLCTFCITWGITVSVESRKRLSVAAGGLSIILLIWGVMSLAAFQRHTSAPAVEVPHGTHAVTMNLPYPTGQE